MLIYLHNLKLEMFNNSSHTEFLAFFANLKNLIRVEINLIK
jgi:hypothetical protein